MQYTAPTTTYRHCQELISALKAAGIEANVTAGGVNVQATPEQIGTAQAICKEHRTTLDAGPSRHAQDVLLRGQGADTLIQVTRDSQAMIEEWGQQP